MIALIDMYLLTSGIKMMINYKHNSFITTVPEDSIMKNYYLTIIQKFLKYKYPMCSIADISDLGGSNDFWDLSNVYTTYNLFICGATPINPISKTII